MFDQQIFDSLQQKIDEDIAVRDKLRDIIQTLEKQDRATQATLSRAHATKAADLIPILDAAQESIKLQIASISTLAQEASKYPYYKYNGMWTRHIQDTIFTILLESYLRNAHHTLSSDPASSLLPLSQIGTLLSLPTNSKTDTFHLTTEEYLHALLSLVEELSRLSRNAVTMGDYAGAVAIAGFVKAVHGGFQVLNLRNDSLRKRADGVKYRVKEVEDVVYDLSLRGLVPR